MNSGAIHVGDEQDQQVEGAPEEPYPEPPGAAHDGHQPEHGQDDRGADDDAEQRVLEQVGEEQGERHAVESVTRLDDELAIEREGQVDGRPDRHDAEDQGEAVDQAVDTRRPEFMQPGEPAADGEGEQQRRIDQCRQNGHPVAVDRVIGGF